MRLANPEWLWILPALALLAWFYPALGLRKPFRLICALLLVFALADPTSRRIGEGTDVWVLCDRSASAKALLEKELPKWEKLVSDSRRGRDRVFFLDFADGSEPRPDPAARDYGGAAGQTRVGGALRRVLNERDPDRATRALILSDGFPTDDYESVREALVREGVAVDWRFVASAQGKDFAVRQLRAPEGAQLGETFLVEAEVESNTDGPTPYVILRDGVEAASGNVVIEKGRGRIRKADQLMTAGAHRYEFRLLTPDEQPGNNTRALWIEGRSAPRLLWVTAFSPDPAADSLRKLGFSVEEVTRFTDLNPGRLSGAKAVVFNNVPAHLIPRAFLDRLDYFVLKQGGGLAMFGGKNSFGSGGWFKSPVDPLLPLSLELRQEQRKLRVSMAVVMDRSGSMGAPVGSGKVKMDLANAGTSEAIKLLGDQDLVTVIAVDSSPHDMVPLMQVGPNRADIEQRVRRVQSTGGGIFVYQGLLGAWKSLQNGVGNKHIILFADAADAEEPGDYIELLRRITEAGATCSVIGLGTDKDSDADFLKDVAKRGKGRIFFTDKPEELPAVFAQETVAVARSSFVDEPTALQAAAGWREISPQAQNWLPKVDGYNLSYLRPGATAGAFTADDQKAPLAAWWARGSGRVAAVAFPVGGEKTNLVRGWSGYGDFLQTLMRWTAGEEQPEGLGLRAKIKGDQAILELAYDEDWEAKFASEPPTLSATSGGNDKALDIVWERLRPGVFTASVQLRPGEVWEAAVKVGKHSLPLGPFGTDESLEWDNDPAKSRSLMAFAAATGGAEVADFRDIWSRQLRETWSSWRNPLMWAWLVLALLEAWQSRAGWKLRLPHKKTATA